MKTTFLAVSVCVVLSLCRLQLSAGGGTIPVSTQNGPTLYVPASKSAPEHVHLLDQRRKDLDRLLDLYNYNLNASPWDFKELQSPLIKKDAIFKFESVESSEGSSAFVAIVPLAGGEICIVPLWDHGLRTIRNLELDPHNIAIFNALVAREQPILKTDSDRLNLPVLYLHFFEEQPKILEETNLTATLGKTLPERTKSLLPSVKVRANDAFDVRLFEQTAADGFGEISFSFDRNGILRNLAKETRAKTELLDGPDW
jgi:hypothetical protein